MNSLLEKVNELKFFLEGSNSVPDVKVSRSNISGVGVFTTKSLKEGDIVGISHINSKEGWNETSPLGRYYNHSDTPNCVVKTVGNINLLMGNTPILTNEELTVDYRKQPYLEQPGDWALAEAKRSSKPISKEEHKKLPKRRGSKRGVGRDLPPPFNKLRRKPSSDDDPDEPDAPQYTVS